MKLKPLFVVLVLALATVSCANSTSEGAGGGSPAMSMGSTGMASIGTQPSGESEGFTFGRPADPDDAGRTVEIAQLDALRFDPASVDVEMGETVTFTVTNKGKTPHEFVLGDQMLQDEHETAMREMAGELMQDEVNAITVPPGKSESVTWRFTKAGTVLYGCHISGHYAAGMVGTISVAA